MWRSAIAIVALAAACSRAQPSFNIASLRPTADADQVSLTGWFQLVDGRFRLYPEHRRAGTAGKSVCLSGVLLSTAGIPTPEFSNRTMTVSGYLRTAGSLEAGSASDECGAGLIMQATELTTP